jgi:hypothetical protein
MNARLPERGLPVVLMLAGSLLSARGQFLYQQAPEEAQLFKCRINSGSVGVYSEGAYEWSQYSGSTPVNYTHIFVGPSVGLALDGSIYHPNLARFNFTGEGAYGRFQENIHSVSSTYNSGKEFLGNFVSYLNLFDTKPYVSVASASLIHTYRNYDFFNRTVVDTLRYGFQTGYREGPLTFGVTAWHQDEQDVYPSGFQNVTNVTSGGKTNVTTKSLYQTSNLTQDTLTFDAGNEHPTGSTRFNYGYNNFTRSGFAQQNGGTDQVLGFSDTENFGSRKQILWNTDAGYVMRRFTDGPSDDLNANTHLGIDHTPTVSTYYDANYYNSTAGPDNSDSLDGSVALRHQLYQSLTSTFKTSGQQYESSSPGGSSDTSQYGGSINEAYVKQINSSTHLFANGMVELDHTEVNQVGSSVSVINEPHAFSNGAGGAPVGTFPLNLPNVDQSTIVVKDLTQTITYTQPLDYTVSQNGIITFLTRTGGSTIPIGATVLVSYTATPSPSGSYNTLIGLLQMRIEFWNGLLGVYGRLNTVQNNGTPGLVVQNLDAVDVGSDVNWHVLRAGLEYEIYNSNFSSYRLTRLYQSLLFNPDEVTRLSFDFSQSWTHYLDADRNDQTYTFINRFNRHLTRRLGFDVEAGAMLRYGPGVDQTLITFRPGLEFAMGKLSVKMEYDFEYDRFLQTQEEIKNFFFIRAKRVF